MNHYFLTYLDDMMLARVCRRMSRFLSLSMTISSESSAPRPLSDSRPTWRLSYTYYVLCIRESTVIRIRDDTVRHHYHFTHDHDR